MFENAYLIGKTRSSITLETRLGNSIDNIIEPDIGPFEVAKFERMKKKHGTNWEIRRPATGRYNCAGLVFANRRTSILKPDLYLKILKDDGYRRVMSEIGLKSGDIAAYVDKGSGDIDHLAIILRIEPGVALAGARNRSHPGGELRSLCFRKF